MNKNFSVIFGTLQCIEYNIAFLNYILKQDLIGGFQLQVKQLDEYK